MPCCRISDKSLSSSLVGLTKARQHIDSLSKNNPNTSEARQSVKVTGQIFSSPRPSFQHGTHVQRGNSSVLHDAMTEGIAYEHQPILPSFADLTSQLEQEDAHIPLPDRSYQKER